MVQIPYGNPLDDAPLAGDDEEAVAEAPAEKPAEAPAEKPMDRLRAFGRRLGRRLLWIGLGMLVLLAFWGAHDLDRRVRDWRHNGETWSDLETWPEAVPEYTEPGFEPVEAPPHEAAAIATLEERAIVALRLRGLQLPVRDVEPSDLFNSFGDARSGGRHHGAIDIPAPEGTPVLAADDGTITTKASGGLGGKHLFQLDETGSFVYYYAHLDGWSWGLEEGDRVRRGDVLGFVGTTGNAPVDAPHLHFAIYKIVPGRSGSGVPINPWRVLAPVE